LKLRAKRLFTSLDSDRNHKPKDKTLRMASKSLTMRLSTRKKELTMTEYQEKLKLAQLLQGKYDQLGFICDITTYNDLFVICVQINEPKGSPVVGMEISRDFTIPELYELNTVLDSELNIK
jgi:hypothetical protein